MNKKIFQDAAEMTFAKMLLVQLVFVEDKDASSNIYDISGVIGFHGDIVGNVALSLSEETAMEAISRLVGEKITNLNDTKDGVGELVNMVAGNARLGFEDMDIRLTIPEIIKGKGHELDFTRYSEYFVLRFASEIGPVHLKVAYSAESIRQGLNS